MPEVILSAQDLVKHYPIKAGVLRRTVGQVKAVDGVSFELHKGETLGIVGESGCGKSTLGRLLMRLEEPTSGTVTFEGADWSGAKGRDLRRMRRDIQIVFQDPYTSLNPRMTVGDIVGEPLEIHRDVVPKGGRRKRVQELLDLVGLNPEHINRYPHQFSGGQRQRIGIARGIALNPKVLVCDEPVSALDVSVQAQVVNLMEKLQDELGLAYVFIAHDLSVVRHISDRVGVMYLGRLAELGEEDEVYTRPTHPYTQALLSAVPVPDPTLRGKREQIVLVGDVPSPANPPSGCRFHTRCWKAQDRCKTEEPQLELRPDGLAEHLSSCHFAEARTIVETVDVSDTVPDPRFAVTDLRDDVISEEGPADLQQMADRSEAGSGAQGYAPQDTTRLIDEQPGDTTGAEGSLARIASTTCRSGPSPTRVV
jgi:oligopeptide transport system ATP-binding protein